MSTVAALTRHPVYYPAVDGLRAVAVLSVLVFHLNGFAPSGYVGVDIFFVISGFVVASAAADLPCHSLGAFAAAFYARRLTRIAPALCVCLVTTMTVAMLITPNAWLSGGTISAGLAAFAGVSNLVLAWTANDYWSPRTEFNPFTHTWSLGVEEQFYLVFPLIFVAWQRMRRPAAFRVLVTLMLLSLLGAVHADARKLSTLAFYSLHTRFWELGAGVLLAMTQQRWQTGVRALSPSFSAALGWSALAGLAASMVWSDPGRFPWPWALLPVICTVALIANVVGRPEGRVARWLGCAPAVTIGKMSYSLYLWHWPVFVLMRWTTGMESTESQSLALALAVGLAWLSYRFVEQPLRRSPRFLAMPRARFTFSALGAVAGLAAVAGLTALARPYISLSVTRDDATWSPDARLPVSGGVSCRVERENVPLSTGQAQTYTSNGCGHIGNHTIYAAGDSHAAAYAASFRYVAQTTGSKVVVFTSSGCNVLGLRRPSYSGNPGCAAFGKAVIDRVVRDAVPGDVLFLPSLRVPRLRDQWGGVNASAYAVDDRESAAAEAVAWLEPVVRAGVRVVFEAPKPIFRAPPFRCSDWFNARNPVCAGGLTMDRSEMERLRAPVLQTMQIIARQVTVQVWDPLPLLCSPTLCDAFRDGKPLFFDGDHLSGFGNKVLAPALSAALSRVA